MMRMRCLMLNDLTFMIVTDSIGVTNYTLLKMAMRVPQLTNRWHQVLMKRLKTFRLHMFISISDG